MSFEQEPAERSRRNTSISGENDTLPDISSLQAAELQDDTLEGDRLTDAERQRQPSTDSKSKESLRIIPQESPYRCEPTGHGISKPTLSAVASSHRSPSRISTPSRGATEAPNPMARSDSQHGRPLEPPITRHTLSELDVTKIVHNPKLRHDINFDPDLHFRPNIEGEKGRRKQQKSDWFWCRLLTELTNFVIDRPKFMEDIGSRLNDWCLPKLLKTYYEILQTLVPQRDRQFLDEGLNVDLLMQQFFKGVLDLEKLALWLSCVLKSHCAPMRDEEVDAMFNHIKTGNQNNDIDQIVLGLRELLCVLEHMKLDVANHQIRCLRPILIDDTVHFEQRYFYRRIRTGKLNVDESRQWYKDTVARVGQSAGATDPDFGDMAVLFEGFTRLILPSSAGQRIPETFQHDYERIVKLRADILDAVNIDICMRLHEDLERVSRYSQCLEKARMGDSQATDNTSNSAFPYANFSPVGSVCSSPRSSIGDMPAYVVPDHNEVSAKALNLQRSLLRLLQQQPHTPNPITRWQGVAPSLALEIVRTADALPMLSVVEEKLLSSFCQLETQMYADAERSLHSRLMEALRIRVKSLRGLSGIALYSAVTDTKPYQSKIVSRQSLPLDPIDLALETGVEDMVKRVAHVGILHWRVWATLAYNDNTEP